MPSSVKLTVPTHKIPTAVKVGSGCCLLVVIGLIALVVGFTAMITEHYSYDKQVDEVNWQVYTDKTLQLELKYPSGIHVWDLPYDGIQISPQGVVNDFVTTNNYNQTTFNYDDQTQSGPALNVTWSKFGLPSSATNKSQVTIGGLPATRYTAYEEGDLYRRPLVGYLFSDYKGQSLRVEFFGDQKMNALEQHVIDSLTFF